MEEVLPNESSREYVRRGDADVCWRTSTHPDGIPSPCSLSGDPSLPLSLLLDSDQGEPETMNKNMKYHVNKIRTKLQHLTLLHDQEYYYMPSSTSSLPLSPMPGIATRTQDHKNQITIATSSSTELTQQIVISPT